MRGIIDVSCARGLHVGKSQEGSVRLLIGQAGAGGSLLLLILVEHFGSWRACVSVCAVVVVSGRSSQCGFVGHVMFPVGVVFCM